jgi:hypothetical protein
MDARGAQELRDYIVAASGELPDNPAPIRDASAPPIFAWVGVPAPPRPAEVDPGEPPSMRLRISGFLARIRRR